MATSDEAGLTGPFPPGVDPDEYDKLRRRVLWSFPYGLFVIGSRAGGRRNAMTLNWLTQLSFDPKLVGIGVEQSALTHELIAEGGCFTVNTVDREDRAIVRKFTKPVDIDLAPSGVAGTLNDFGFHDGPVTGAPVLDQAVAFLECTVRHTLDCGDHTLFLGELANCGFQKAEGTPVLRMEDTRMNYGG